MDHGIYVVRAQVRQRSGSVCPPAKCRLAQVIGGEMLVDPATPVGPACFRLNYGETEADVAVLCISCSPNSKDIVIDRTSKIRMKEQQQLFFIGK